jgi:hypothetical protein
MAMTDVELAMTSHRLASHLISKLIADLSRHNNEAARSLFGEDAEDMLNHLRRLRAEHHHKANHWQRVYADQQKEKNPYGRTEKGRAVPSGTEHSRRNR